MTIKDIARLSGCGVATVSRVLNNHPDVSEETRNRVMAVVEQYDFQPNNNAKHLKQQAGTSIAVVVKGTQNMLFADLVEQVQALLRSSDRDAVVYYLDEEANEVAYALQLCRERKPLGILFLGGNLDFFRESFGQITIPCVLLTNTAAELGFTNLSSLTTDDRAAAACAVEHLLELGHRRIGLLGGNWDCSQIAYSRVLGCRDSLQRYGVPFDPGTYESCRYSMEEGYEAVGRLLARNPDLTAIFAVSDVMAMGAIRALQDMGKRVPEDISVVGYDGIAMGKYTIPRLTTVRQDTRRLAERGVELLLDSLQRQRRPVHTVIPFQLIAGESVAALEG